MKKLLLFVFCSLVGVSLFALPINGNGKVVKIERTVPLFKEIYASSVFEVIVHQGEFSHLILEVDENILPLIETKVSGDKLHLNLKERVRNITTLKVHISMPELNKIDISGAAKASLENDFQSNNFTADVSGAAKISIKYLSATNIRLDISGAAKASGKFKGDDFVLSNSGASKGVFEGIFKKISVRTDGAAKTELIAKVDNEAKINTSGTGKLTGSINADVIQVNSNGASGVILSGKCKKQSLDASGSSFINMSEMNGNETEISASGASRVEVAKTYITKMQSSGAASIKTKGTLKKKKINIQVKDTSSDVKQLTKDLARIQLDLEDQSEDLEKLGEEFISLLTELMKSSNNAMIEVNSKTYLLKDVKISTTKKQNGKLVLFINGEEVYEFN